MKEFRTMSGFKRRYTFVLTSIAVILIAVFSYASAGWNRVKIGTCPTAGLEEIEVADGRNDGINRVYVVTRDGGIYEWTYAGGSWSCETVSYIGSETFTPLAVGSGRNDGTNRVYTGEYLYSGDIIEATFSGGEWAREYVQTSIGNVLCVKVGDGRNDGVSRLYVGGQFFGLYEYTRSGSNWSELVINSSIIGGTHDIADGRNDGIKRIYCPDRRGPLYEFSWNGTSYDEAVINLPQQWIVGVSVGQGRNDGINRIYAAVENGHLYEVTYAYSGWQVLDITPSGPNKSRYGIRIGKTKSEGKYLLYATQQGGDLREYSWNGSTYEDSVVIDAVTGATACLSIGIGRNDDTVRIYATNYSTRAIYEVTNTSPYYAVTEGNWGGSSYKLEQNYPNPFTQMTEIRFQITNGVSKIPVSVRIYDMAGRLVKTLIDKKWNTGVYKIIWNGEDKLGNRVAAGIYFYRLETGKSIISKKLVVLRGN
ncbi:MAG: T9SS type A sorting domain-containing protein [bacterium]|nr:T9SS type A sorting domain-containing protein [bacterium]